MHRFAILALLLLFTSRTIAVERPNVVIIMSDDHGSQDFGFAGNRAVRTPHLDSLARESMRFTRFHMSPACAPTRAGLLTGRDACATGVWGVHRGKDYLHPQEYTLAHAMTAAGYATGCFGKWHNGKSLGFHPRDFGFTTEVVGANNPYRYFDQTLLHNGREVQIAGPQDDVLVDRAIAFVSEHTRAHKPWLCYLPFPSVHRPLSAPPDMIAAYKAKGLPEELAELYAMIERQDHNIGRLLACIDELGQRDNTIVMFLVDDGIKPLSDKSSQKKREAAWARRYRGAKASIYQGGLHSPLLVRWPGRCTPGHESTVLASVTDIFPTLTAIAGLPIPNDHHGFHGVNLAPTLRGNDNGVPADRWFGVNQNYYLQHGGGVTGAGAYTLKGGPTRAVLQGPFKYVREGRNGRLYNLFDDPMERTDLANAQPERAKAMASLLDTYWKRCLTSPHALYLPRFRIGGWEHPKSQIHPYAPKDLRGGARRLPKYNHAIAGFDRPGATAVYPVHIREAGSYRIHLGSNAKHGKPPQGTARITIGTTAIDVPLTAKTTINGIWTNISPRVDLPAGDADLAIAITDIGADGHGLGALNRIAVERIAGANTVLAGLRVDGLNTLTPDGGRIRLRADRAWTSAEAWLDFEPAAVDADGWIIVPPWAQRDRLSITVIATAQDGRTRKLHVHTLDTPL